MSRDMTNVSDIIDALGGNAAIAPLILLILIKTAIDLGLLVQADPSMEQTIVDATGKTGT